MSYREDLMDELETQILPYTWRSLPEYERILVSLAEYVLNEIEEQLGMLIND